MLQNLKETIERKRGKKIRRAHFTEWHSLFAYFSKFTSSKATYSALKLSSNHFLSKYWSRLRRYTFIKRIDRTNRLTADHKFFNRYVKICFNNWAHFILVKQKKLAVAKRKME